MVGSDRRTIRRVTLDEHRRKQFKMGGWDRTGPTAAARTEDGWTGPTAAARTDASPNPPLLGRRGEDQPSLPSVYCASRELHFILSFGVGFYVELSADLLCAFSRACRNRDGKMS